MPVKHPKDGELEPIETASRDELASVVAHEFARITFQGRHDVRTGQGRLADVLRWICLLAFRRTTVPSVLVSQRYGGALIPRFWPLASP